MNESFKRIAVGTAGSIALIEALTAVATFLPDSMVGQGMHWYHDTVSPSGQTSEEFYDPKNYDRNAIGLVLAGLIGGPLVFGTQEVLRSVFKRNS